MYSFSGSEKPLLLVGSGADCFFVVFLLFAVISLTLLYWLNFHASQYFFYIQASVCYSVPWSGRPQLLVGASDNCIFLYIFFSNASALNGNNVTRDTTPFIIIISDIFIMSSLCYALSYSSGFLIVKLWSF